MNCSEMILKAIVLDASVIQGVYNVCIGFLKFFSKDNILCRSFFGYGACITSLM